MNQQIMEGRLKQPAINQLRPPLYEKQIQEDYSSSWVLSSKISHTGLPHLTHSRHSFFKTISKKANLNKSMNLKEKGIQDQLIEIQQERLFRESSNKASIYQIQYLRKQNGSKIHKRHLNSTYRKIIMSSRLSPPHTMKQPQTFKQISENMSSMKKYNTIDNSVQRCENRMFCPRMRNKDIGKKKSEVIKEYLDRYSTKQQQITQSKLQIDKPNWMNTTNMSIFNEKKTVQKLQKLKIALEQRKHEYANSNRNHVANKISLSNRYKNILDRELTKNKSKSKIRADNYGPWDNQNPESEYIQLY